MTSYDGQAVTYDEIGNPLSYRGYTMEWQNGRQLAAMNGVGLSAGYQYDSAGFRASKTVNGIKSDYYYVEDKLTYEKRGDGKELYYFYDNNGVITGIRYVQNGTATDYVLVTNWRGDVESIYSAAGTELARYSYDAWGKVTSVRTPAGAAITDSEHIANVNPMRYRGYYQDTETGLYYLQSRYYDPVSHRFMNADRLLGANGDILSNNLYAYCSNNPISYFDDVGEGKFWNSVKNAWNSFTDLFSGSSKKPAPQNFAMGAGHTSSAGSTNSNANNSNYSYSRKKENQGSRKDKKKGSENRQPSGARERNKKHPNGEEHSRVPKGNNTVRRIVISAIVVAEVVTLIWFVANDVTGIGAADDTLIVPCVAIFIKTVEAF